MRNKFPRQTYQSPVETSRIKKKDPRIFYFLNNVQPTDDLGLADEWDGLLPDTPGEDYRKEAFAKQMKKKAIEKTP
ncbi:MAG: hypothetical protein ACTHZ1_13450 [Sphingobacterium sp.]